MAPPGTRETVDGPDGHLIRLTDLLGLMVGDERGNALGRLRDVAARVIPDTPPLVSGLVVRRGNQDLVAPVSAADQLIVEAGRLSTKIDVRVLEPLDRQPGEVLLEHDLLDGTVIDLLGPRVVRVNDILLKRATSAWQVTGIDVGSAALLHRLLPRALRHATAPRLLGWAELELLAHDLPDGILPAEHPRLARLHPADIARIADALPVWQASEIVAALDDDLAADVMEEMVDERQEDVVERLDPERAAEILEHMAPDAAADVLAALEPAEVDAMLGAMDPARAAEAHALLTYAPDTAGGLMTTDYVVAPANLRAGEAAAYLRPQLAGPDWVYYVYVVSDTQERQLLGVLTLRDLLLAEPDQLLSAVMRQDVRAVGPETAAARVAQVMSDYNLLALPVTDTRGRMLGIVGVDDALEVVLPATLRRRLPRIFS